MRFGWLVASSALSLDDLLHPLRKDLVLEGPQIAYLPSDTPLTALNSLRWTRGIVVEENVKLQFDAIQGFAPWSLSRISYREAIDSTGKSSLEAYPYQYTEMYLGQGSDIYILDTGIACDHEDFNGRAVCNPENDVSAGARTQQHTPSTYDVSAHGTGVAGCAAGGTFGVAKASRIISIRVASTYEDGTTLVEAIRGIHLAVGLAGHVGRKSVINMSFGVPAAHSKSLDLAVARAVHFGLPIVTSASNYGGDACLARPCASEYTLCVGGTTMSDWLWQPSARGRCIGLLAPASQIVTTWPGGDNRQASEVEGNSFAAGYVAGALAVWYDVPWTKFASVEVMTRWMHDTALAGAIKGLGAHTPNLFLQTNILAKKRISNDIKAGWHTDRAARRAAARASRSASESSQSLLSASYRAVHARPTALRPAWIVRGSGVSGNLDRKVEPGPTPPPRRNRGSRSSMAAERRTARAERRREERRARSAAAATTRQDSFSPEATPAPSPTARSVTKTAVSAPT
ncbi:hypothetical protein PYCC9005_004123 [Savitreella phatthalungensis]